MLAIAMALLAKSAVAPKTPLLKPLGRYQDWFSARDYPQDATIARQQGTVGFALDIDANGLPSDCRVEKSSGSKSLDDRTCTIMMSRARFRPFKDRKGRAVATTFRHSMVWRLPSRKQETTTADRSFDARSMIASSGEVLSCTLSGVGASKLATAGGSCGPFGDRGFLSYFLQDNYRKARSTNVRLSILFNGASPHFDRQPNFEKELAKATIDIAPSGEMTGCTSLLKMEALGHAMDLCDFIRADPPRFPKGPTARKAFLLLDLSAYFG